VIRRYCIASHFFVALLARTKTIFEHGVGVGLDRNITGARFKYHTSVCAPSSCSTVADMASCGPQVVSHHGLGLPASALLEYR